MSSQKTQKEILKQKRHHWMVEEDAFLWQTCNNYIKKMEMHLLESLIEIIKQTKSEHILEVGCGEGANIYNIVEYTEKTGIKNIKFTGIDYSREKILFARKHIPSSNFQCMDATKLECADASFDIVFARDILHHIPKKNKLVHELLRVAKKRVIIIESNGNNPIMWVFGTVESIEKDVKNSVPIKVNKIIRRDGLSGDMKMNYYEPCPLARFILHYRYGLPKLSKINFICRGFDFIDGICRAIIPKKFWSYVIYDIKKT